VKTLLFRARKLLLSQSVRRERAAACGPDAGEMARTSKPEQDRGGGPQPSARAVPLATFF
jgi:hypothetical protein